jgi:hypothetical protein
MKASIIMGLLTIMGSVFLMGCEDSSGHQARLRNFQVQIPFSAKSYSGQMVPFQVGVQEGKWSLRAKGSDNAGYTAVLHREKPELNFEFKVPKGYQFGAGSIDASVTGQNLGLASVVDRSEAYDEGVKERTESCTIERDEFWCEPNGSCHNRRVTRPGFRRVREHIKGTAHHGRFFINAPTGAVVAQAEAVRYDDKSVRQVQECR